MQAVEWSLRDRDAAATFTRVIWNGALFVSLLAASSVFHVWIDPSLPAYHHGESAQTTILTALFGLTVVSGPAVALYLGAVELIGRRARRPRLPTTALGTLNGAGTAFLWSYAGAGVVSILALPLWILYSLVVATPARVPGVPESGRAVRFGLAVAVAVIGIAADVLATSGAGAAIQAGL